MLCDKRGLIDAFDNKCRDDTDDELADEQSPKISFYAK